MNKSAIFLISCLAFSGCQKPPENQKQLNWYKGNTHTHTELCGHADSHPDTVALWYLERDYNFLILSEHEQFIDPASVNLPPDRRQDFILIGGQEVSDFNHIHFTAMNISRAVHPHPHESDRLRLKNDPEFASNVNLMQRYVDSTISTGGKPILNHPNYVKSVPAKDIQQVKRLNLLELYNGHPSVYSFGSDKLPSVEEKWDSLLTAGKRMFGVSSDDAHSFKEWGENKSNPGRGWVMVRSEVLTPAAITDAIYQGNFYATSGVMLSLVNISQEIYELEVDTAATLQVTQSPYLVSFKTDEMEGEWKEGFSISFITDGGKIIGKIDEAAAKMEVPSGISYLRAKITYSTKRNGYGEQFFAWTQPVFLDH